MMLRGSYSERPCTDVESVELAGTRVVLAGGLMIGPWKWSRNRFFEYQATSWPAVMGRVLYTHADKNEHDNSSSWTAVIEFEFEQDGKFYGAKYQKGFSGHRSAKEFLQGLDKLPIELRYDPNSRPYRVVGMPEAVERLRAQRMEMPRVAEGTPEARLRLVSCIDSAGAKSAPPK